MIDIKPLTTPEDMAQSRTWTARFIGDPARLPISFLYGGKAIAGIPESWKPVTVKNRIDATIMQTIFEGVDDATGLALRVEALEYRDFPVVEWTAWLSNRGNQSTPLISDFLALDAGFDAPATQAGDKTEPPAVIHCNGDFYSPEGYTPQETPLADDVTVTFAPHGGRPCDRTFPYFRLIFEDGGMSLAIGWPGQWSASFTRAGNAVEIKAGQEQTHLRLNPGETIRSPRITLLAWDGDASRAVNLWRRWYLSHVLPRPDGKPMRPLMAVAATDPGEEFTAATEENQLRYMDRFKAAGLDFDVWWIDAGWYPCYDEKHERRWPLTGTWVPDPERFPRGMRSIADNAARHGARLLLWFEPERVTQGSWLDSEHPEWLLRAEGEDRNRLLNLGDPACRTWLTDHVSDLIQQNGIGVYRQDFNFEPLRFWRENDPEDRQGISENFHVQGYLQYWDDLLLRNPGLWIDSCSSGGRRNDMETMRRSVPLHYTDSSYGVHPVKLAFHHTLTQWIPYFKEFTLSWDLETPETYQDAHADKPVDEFSFHCGMAPMIFPIINIRSGTYDHSPEVRMLEIWRRAANLMLYGDYYPLTPFSRSPERWVVRQFDQPESGEGLVQAIRLAECAEERFAFHPMGLLADQDYIFENPESGQKLKIGGAALTKEGFPVEMPRRSGAIWFYHRIKDSTKTMKNFITNDYDPTAPRSRLPVERVFLYRPQAAWTYSHHASITFFQGRTYALWSNGRIHEDYPGQRVLVASSADFYTWTEPQALIGPLMGKHSELVLTASGFHGYGGTLAAYYGAYEYKAEAVQSGIRGGRDHQDTSLWAITTRDGLTWSQPQAMQIPIVPNHGPQATRSGRLVICGNIAFPYTDDPAGLTGWTMTGIYPADMAERIYDDSEAFWTVQMRQGWPAGLCEGSFYQTDEGILHMLLRATGSGYADKLWQTESADDGATWLPPQESGFSDNNTKFHFGRLPDGRFYYVGSPDPLPRGARCPLVLSLSQDGVRFNQHFILADEDYPMAKEGLHKGGVYGYPHTMVHDAYLYVIYSLRKEAVQVLRVAISQL